MQKSNEAFFIKFKKINHHFCRIMKKPTNLVEMQNAIDLYDNLFSSVPVIEDRFPKIKDQLMILDKHKVDVPDEVRKLENSIPVEWAKYLEILAEAEKMLSYTKVSLAKAA